ncbi:copper resistance CopC family protein [Leifsonia sp. NPDC058248]|uniref:copper resistance CopC family protein n=1 Tax=Leifsonia sp. NPDC058248 TaxID=3346402 RepID=UPI0036D77500
MTRLRLLTASVAALGAVALALLPVVGASAHDYLVDSDPKSGAVVTQPLQRVSLTFNDRVLDLAGDGSGSLVTVTGPDAGSRHFETGCATVADRVVSAPVALGAAGTYTVTYQVVSADGHTVSDALTFTYRPPAGAVAAAGSDAAVCGAKTPASTPRSSATAPAVQPTESAGSAAPTAPASDDSGNLALVIGIGIGIVVLAIAGVLIVVFTSRRKPTE